MLSAEVIEGQLAGCRGRAGGDGAKIGGLVEVDRDGVDVVDGAEEEVEMRGVLGQEG